MTIADRLRINATLLDMILSGEARLRRADLAGLSDDLRKYADELDRREGRSAEIEYQMRRAA